MYSNILFKGRSEVKRKNGFHLFVATLILAILAWIIIARADSHHKFPNVP
jgi:hypothetical protein